MRGLLGRLFTRRPPADPPLPAAPSDFPLPSVPARYYPSLLERELWQGEIITGLTSYTYGPGVADQTQVEVSATERPFAITATPDCDLLQSFKDMRAGRPLKINGILFYEAELADLPARKRHNLNSARWDIVRTNRMEGIHLLLGVNRAADRHGEEIPDLLVDFKRYFMLSVPEVYRQCTPPNGTARRRCYLGDNWRENFQQRAGASWGRVGTPDPND